MNKIKAICLTVSIILSALFLQFGCKKDATGYAAQNKILPENFSRQINNWMESQASGTLVEIGHRVELLHKSLNFDEGSMEKDKNGNSIVIVPVKTDFVSLNNRTKPVTNLAIFAFQENKIICANILQYIKNGDDKSTTPTELAAKVYNGDNLQNDWIALLTMRDEFERELNYKDEKLQSIRTVQSKTVSPKDSKSPTSPHQRCTAYYLVTHWSDGSQDWMYLYTMCDGTSEGGGGCEQTKIIGDMAFRSCGGGGGGESQCESDCRNNRTSLSDGASLVPELGDVELVDVNSLKKIKKVPWVCLKNLTWALYSHEEGEIELINLQQNKWQWNSFTHKSITKVGQSYGGTVTPDNGIGTPSFVAGTANILYAGMSLEFNVTYAPVCDCPGINLILPPYTLAYTNNILVDAKPIP